MHTKKEFLSWFTEYGRYIPINDFDRESSIKTSKT